MVVFRVRDRVVIISQHEKILDALRLRNQELASDAIFEQTAYLQERFRVAQELSDEKNVN